MIFEKITCFSAKNLLWKRSVAVFFLEIIFPNHFGKFYKKHFCGGVPIDVLGAIKDPENQRNLTDFENKVPNKILGPMFWGVKCCRFLGAHLI